MTPSRFTAWLESNGFEHLTPSNNKPYPLNSRIAQLQKRKSSGHDIKTLMRLWERWRTK